MPIRQKIEKYQDTGEYQTPYQPERQLVAAILSRCFEDAYGYAGILPHIRRQAREWMRINDSSTPFTFAWCCLNLSLDPELIRKSLVELKYCFDIGKTFRGQKRKSNLKQNANRINSN